MKFFFWKIPVGTIFKWILRPFVWSYDLFWGTDLMFCDVCKEREKQLNEDFWGVVKRSLTRKQ